MMINTWLIIKVNTVYTLLTVFMHNEHRYLQDPINGHNQCDVIWW